MSIRDLSNIKGLYDYLKEIDFENKVKEEVSTIKKVNFIVMFVKKEFSWKI